mgnify:FL=1
MAITADDQRCWEWQGHLDWGYGRMHYKGKHYRAHRLAWFMTYGEMPTLSILHSCDNKKCVNPNHLREGTHKENMQDKVDRNRTAKGQHNGNAILTESDVIKIRELLSQKVATQKVADMFGIARVTASHIKNRRSWKHL